MFPTTSGKFTSKDERIARLLGWTPWLSFFLITLPLPLVFLTLFLAATTTDSAAIYLLLSLVSMGLGLIAGLAVLIFLLIQRKRWHSRLRDRLAADGITAAEVTWFMHELSPEERLTWRELKNNNPLLADAYCETLAARLTASRIINRTRGELLKVKKQINRTRNIADVDTSELINDLVADGQRLEDLRQKATVRLSEAKARLQAVEAAASRTLSQNETAVMLRRLTAAQEHFPLSLEMAKLEQQALAGTDFQPEDSGKSQTGRSSQNESSSSS